MRIRLARKIQRNPHRYRVGKYFAALIRLGWHVAGKWKLVVTTKG